MKKLLRTLLVTAIVLIALTGIKNEYARLLMSDANYGLQALIVRSTQSGRAGTEESYDLYVGSSMFRQGLDVEELEKSGVKVTVDDAYTLLKKIELFFHK